VRREDLKWNGWGLASKVGSLEGRSALLPYIREILQMDQLPSTPSVSLDEVRLPPSRLAADILRLLRAAVGDNKIRDSRFERVFHSAGRSMHDLFRLRFNLLESFVDAVAYPHDQEDLQRLMKVARENNLVLIPFGGGSTVVGGLEPLAVEGKWGIVSVDLTEMNTLLSIDKVSRQATFQAGVYGPKLEERLNAIGYSLGHFPQSFEFSTLGGWVATRSSGQQSLGYGNIADRVASLKILTPRGELVTLNVPNTAAGPSIKEMLMGSEGLYGFITEVTVRIHPKPEKIEYAGFLFHNFTEGATFVREALQAGLPCSMIRLSDEMETKSFSKMRVQHAPGFKDRLGKALIKMKGFTQDSCLLVAGFEGDDATACNWRALRKVARKHGAFSLGSGAGKSWYKDRFEAPYLRDTLLDMGLAIDTLETATTWHNLQNLKTAITRALLGHMQGKGDKGTVLCHISHGYPDGASLYFTIVYRIDTAKPVEQWFGIKKSASDAILANGGTITHHHGIGVDHAPWAEKEWGSLGTSMLRALKKELDPDQVMNPGMLCRK
jgi:alkyldihydroxyacetonephosphate synthase